MSAPTRLSASKLVTDLLDPGSFRAWSSPAAASAPANSAPGYLDELEAARHRTGAIESVLTGHGAIRGHRVAVIASEFGFLGGSIGLVAAETLLETIERATAHRYPLVALAASGGTRMQEGTPAFLTLPAVAAAVEAHKEAGLLYLTYLRHPTTGGVLASWGSQGQLTFAEPSALIGFLGPKVYAGLHGHRFPEGVQTAENLRDHGIVDDVLAPEALTVRLGDLLDLLYLPGPAPAVVDVSGPAPDPAAPPTSPAEAVSEPRPATATEAWEAVGRTRRPDRPGACELLAQNGAPLVELSGDGHGKLARGLVVGLTRFGTERCVVIGQDRTGQRRGARLGPGSLRTARRALALGAQLGLPVLTLVDTAGADLSPAAEQDALAGEISQCLVAMSTAPTATLSVLLGQGGGGAALAMLPADRVLAARHAWLTPLPPEGASIIVHGTPDRAATLATTQRITATELARAGLVDVVVDETPDAADEPQAFNARLASSIERELAAVRAMDPARRREARRQRYRRLLQT